MCRSRLCPIFMGLSVYGTYRATKDWNWDWDWDTRPRNPNGPHKSMLSMYQLPISTTDSENFAPAHSYLPPVDSASLPLLSPTRPAAATRIVSPAASQLSAPTATTALKKVGGCFEGPRIGYIAGCAGGFSEPCDSFPTKVQAEAACLGMQPAACGGLTRRGSAGEFELRAGNVIKPTRLDELSYLRPDDSANGCPDATIPSPGELSHVVAPAPPTSLASSRALCYSSASLPTSHVATHSLLYRLSDAAVPFKNLWAAKAGCTRRAPACEAVGANSGACDGSTCEPEFVLLGQADGGGEGAYEPEVIWRRLDCTGTTGTGPGRNIESFQVAAQLGAEQTRLVGSTSSDETSAAFSSARMATAHPRLADGTLLYISVKTTAANRNHRARVLPALLSWAAEPLARRITYFFTDEAETDESVLALAGDGDVEVGRRHFVVTKCASGKRGRALCCKTDAELNAFVEMLNAEEAATESGQSVHKRSWWCHLDDDNYPLLGNLLRYLRSPLFTDRPADEPVYIGRGGPVSHGNRLHAPFAMGGAGYCLNGPAARQAAKAGPLEKVCDEIDYPDDMALGYLVSTKLGIPFIEDGPGTTGRVQGTRWHSQWEIYGLDINQFFAKIQRESPTSDEDAKLRAPVDQLVYGWDRFEKNKRSSPRDLLQLHYWLETFWIDALNGDHSCYGIGFQPGALEEGSRVQALSRLGNACALANGNQNCAATTKFGLLAAMVECAASGRRCAGIMRTSDGWFEPRAAAELGSKIAATGDRAWIKTVGSCLGRALFGVATDEEGL